MAPRVLVVEDDLLVRMDVTESLEEAGFDVVQARDVASALSAIKEVPDVELVCTDVQMPGELNGIDLALHVCRQYRHLQVIVMSGFHKDPALPPDIPFLAKPFRSAQLVDLAVAQLGVPV